MIQDFYYITFQKDRGIVKSMVYAIYMIELAQTIIVTHDAFVTFARGFGDSAQLSSPQLEWFATPILSGIGMLSTNPVPASRLTALYSQLHCPDFLFPPSLHSFTFQDSRQRNYHRTCCDLARILRLIYLGPQIALMQCCAAIYEGTQARITDYEDLALSRRVYVSCTASFRLNLTVP